MRDWEPRAAGRLKNAGRIECVAIFSMAAAVTAAGVLQTELQIRGVRGIWIRARMGAYCGEQVLGDACGGVGCGYLR